MATKKKSSINGYQAELDSINASVAKANESFDAADELVQKYLEDGIHDPSLTDADKAEWEAAISELKSLHPK